MGAILQIIGALLAFIGSLYLDYKARIAAEQMAARNAASNALAAAARAEAEAARCVSRQSEMRRLADQARKLGQDASGLEGRVRELSLSGAKLQNDAINLRIHGNMLADEALSKGVKSRTFMNSLRNFQFSARSLGSKILAGVAAVSALASLNTILQNEIQKLNDNIDSTSNSPCSSGPSNLSLEETGLLELLELID